MPGLLQKMRTVLRGMYGRRSILITWSAGIFDPAPVGILQCYGVAAFDPNLEGLCLDRHNLAALKAGLAARTGRSA